MARPGRFGRGVAQPGSALAWGASGRWFKSSRPDHSFLLHPGRDFMDILLTNDDGIHAEGLAVLRAVARASRNGLGRRAREGAERGEPCPDASPSPPRPPARGTRLLRRWDADRLRPACLTGDRRCARASRLGLVVSGINHGPNLSEDVTYSGTVAAAIEGLMLGLPSMAISAEAWKTAGFDAAGRVARYLVRADPLSGDACGYAAQRQRPRVARAIRDPRLPDDAPGEESLFGIRLPQDGPTRPALLLDRGGADNHRTAGRGRLLGLAGRLMSRSRRSTSI